MKGTNADQNPRSYSSTQLLYPYNSGTTNEEFKVMDLVIRCFQMTAMSFHKPSWNSQWCSSLMSVFEAYCLSSFGQKEQFNDVTFPQQFEKYIE